MGRSAGNLGILEAVLRISVEQKELFRENRLEDLLMLQREREALLGGIETGAADLSEGPLRGLIEKILDNDRLLSLGLENARREVGDKLRNVKQGFRALKAYGGG
ncbi:MAG: flagellar protein FliT [Thermodesulfobacteriota bacterium]